MSQMRVSLSNLDTLRFIFFKIEQNEIFLFLFTFMLLSREREYPLWSANTVLPDDFMCICHFNFSKLPQLNASSRTYSTITLLSTCKSQNQRPFAIWTLVKILNSVDISITFSSLHFSFGFCSGLLVDFLVVYLQVYCNKIFWY